MLFNSLEFILVFLPLTVALAWLATRYLGVRAELIVLAVASVVFYADAGVRATLILLGSMFVNFLIAGTIQNQSRIRTPAFVAGLLFNVGLLGYFKYSSFLVDQLNAMGAAISFGSVTLPLGISFYTFMQIAYLVDTYQAKKISHEFVDYAVFVTFFPHLIAGPIMHHAEMMPQFHNRRGARSFDIAVGLTIFTIGLAKKVFLADNVALFASPVFDAANATPPGLWSAWTAAICYTLQIYFDFSGYSDMAIGIARMFAIRLPYNFASPYKATSITDFWRRWHISLSRFLRDYLYIPLGGSRRGATRTNVNLLTTMIIGGLWHGAGWNFILWGAIHGLMLVFNQLFSSARLVRIPSGVGWILTFMCVVFAWVPFRAETTTATLAIWKGMIGLNGLHDLGNFAKPSRALSWVHVGLVLAFLAPNTQTIMRRARPGLRTRGYPSPYFVRGFWPETARLIWTATWPFAIITAVLLSASIVSLKNVSEFIYFRF